MGASGGSTSDGDTGSTCMRSRRRPASAGALAAELAAAPLVLGADGVLVPFRPTGGQPTGKTQWHEVKVGVLARLSQHRTRTGKVITGCASVGWWRSWGYRGALAAFVAGSRAPGHQHGPPGGLAQ